MVSNIAVIGSSGAIGGALAERLSLIYPDACLHTFSRTSTVDKGDNRDNTSATNRTEHLIDYSDEASIESAAATAAKDLPLDLVMVTTGILHGDGLLPEKSLRDLSAEKFQQLFSANAIVPALIAKYFLPQLNRNQRSVFAVLSARVGSISDNHLGGWYAYRASKAALNMIIKNAAIEIGRRNQQAIVVGLHPGTVDSELSRPFQANVPKGKLFTPEFSASQMLSVLQELTPEQSGRCFAWDGKEIDP